MAGAYSTGSKELTMTDAEKNRIWWALLDAEEEIMRAKLDLDDGSDPEYALRKLLEFAKLAQVRK